MNVNKGKVKMNFIIQPFITQWSKTERLLQIASLLCTVLRGDNDVRSWEGKPPPTWTPSSPPPATPDARGGQPTACWAQVWALVHSQHHSFSCVWIIHDYLKAGSLKGSGMSAVISCNDKRHKEAQSPTWVTVDAGSWGSGTERPQAPAVGAIWVWQLSCSLNASGAHPGKSISNHHKQQGRQGQKQAGPRGAALRPHPSSLKAASSERTSLRGSVVSYTRRRVLFKELAQEPSFCFLNFCLNFCFTSQSS